MKRTRVTTVVLLLILALVVGSLVSLRAASAAGLVECTMTFNLSGWSAFYKTASGRGTITCNNGETAHVKISAKGGGLTFGKSDVIGGKGTFSGARDIKELYGAYAQSEAHAGAVKSADVQALTKGVVSLVLVGKGRGIDLGVAFGKFTITPIK